ncbi:hypothetical protein [Variovorax guangxiensis]|nr:hypothetical protein [Variovorax guangxiensis]
MTSAHRHRLLQAAGFALVLAVLGGVFLMYTRPAFMVTMIDQLWACF